MSADEQTWARNEFSGSRPQKLLHNFLVARIEEFRSRLETAKPEDVLAIQVGIREARTLLGELHAHDSEAVKRIYGP
jgi:CelD/BcsL family acetyltransferase involved in cellulose biosynthesis